MSSEFVETKVREIVADQLGVGVDEVSLDASFSGDLGADALDFMEIVMALEEEFETDIDERDSESLKTVRDAVEYLSRRS